VLINGVGEIGSRLPFILTEIYIAKQLGVASYSIWALIQLVVNYNNFAHFGLLSGLAKLEPMSHHLNDPGYLARLRSSAFYPVLIIDLLLVLLVSIAWLLGGEDWLSPIAEYGFTYEVIISLGVLLFIQQTFLYAQVCLQNQIRFGILSAVKLIYSALFMVSVVFVLEDVKISYLVACWSVSFLGASVLMFFALKGLPALCIDKKLLKELFVFGFPVFCVGIIKLFLLSLDRLFIIPSYTAEDFSLYNISMQAMLVMSVLIGLMTRVFSPYFLRMKGDKTGAAKSFYEFLKLSATYGGAIVAFLCCGVFYVIVGFYIPEFKGGVLAGCILIFSGVYQGAAQLTITSAISNHLESVLVKKYIFAGLGYAALLYVVTSAGFRIEIVAICNLMFWIILDCYLCYSLNGDRVRLIFGPVVFGLVLLIACFSSVAFSEDWWVLLLVQLSGLLIFVAGLVVIFRRRSEIFKNLAKVDV